MNKIFVLLVASLAFASGAQNPLEPLIQMIQDETIPREIVTANINDYLDMTLDNLRQMVEGSPMEKLELPDICEGFSVKPLLITYHGELELTEGICTGLDTIYRYGDAELRYDKKLLGARFHVGVRDLNLHFEYLAKIMGIGPTGQLIAAVQKVEILIDIVIDLDDFSFYLQEFDVPYVGSIDLKFKGNILTDWLVNGITKVVTLIFKNLIVDVVAGQIETLLKDTFDKINTAPRYLTLKTHKLH